MYKCKVGDINGIRRMIRKFGAKIIVNAQWGVWTCLNHAADYGHAEIITLLLKNGADKDFRDGDGQTPLRRAIWKREYSSISALIKFRASLEMSKYNIKYNTYYRKNDEQSEFDKSMREKQTKFALALTGLIQSGSELGMTKADMFSASERYPEYDAKYGWVGESDYWCSNKKEPNLAILTVYWWISLAKSVQIISIKFEEEEEYKGAKFQFFVSSVKEGTVGGRVGDDGQRLIMGTRDEINNMYFENFRSSKYYGLAITALGKNKKYLTIKNFEFYAADSLQSGTHLGLMKTTMFSASSTWSKHGSYSAKYGWVGSSHYWSANYGVKPAYWWISLDTSVEIVSITFKEKKEYKGATFEFFASNKYKAKGDERNVLIRGTRDEINDKDFSNGNSYRYYGLTVTELAKGYYAKYASVKDFDFYMKKERSIIVGSKMKLKMSYSASSHYGSYTAKYGAIQHSSYWCSLWRGGRFTHWWLMSLDKPVEIVSITFEEEYEGATFEFFASNTNDAADANRKVLISGTRNKIAGVKLENGASFRYYGLTITTHGNYASVMNFEFYAKNNVD